MARQQKVHTSGPWFAQHRVEMGLSQAAVAKKVGVSRAYITQIESGHRWPSKETLFAICGAIGVPVSQAIKELELVRNDDAERVVLFAELLEELAPKLPKRRLAQFQRLFASNDDQLQWVVGFALAEPEVPAPADWLRLRPDDKRMINHFVERLVESYAEEAQNGNQA